METPTIVGVSFVPLESIAYMLNIEEQVISIYDYQARHVGHLSVSLVPCSEDGEEMSDEAAVEEPLQLVMYYFSPFQSSQRQYDTESACN